MQPYLPSLNIDPHGHFHPISGAALYVFYEEQRSKNKSVYSKHFQYKAVNGVSLETLNVEIISYIKTCYDVRVYQFRGYYTVITSKECIVQITDGASGISISVFGDENFVNDLFDKYDNTSKLSTVTWFYQGYSRIECKSFPIRETIELKDACYPFLKKSVDSYVSDFIASKVPILIMMGPPGTGKTSFLKYMLSARKMNVACTYDDAVINKDEFFIDYLTNNHIDMLVIEDADLLLRDRESEQNKTMSKLLNVSDGLVPILNKKLIFTTNIDNTKDIDQALMRPGRCYDILHFRNLTHAEALNVCAAYDLPPLEDTKREYALADVFNRQPRGEVVRRKMGII